MFHERLLHTKGGLSEHPVECERLPEAATFKNFFNRRTITSVILVMGTLITWLHVPQAMRALRRSPHHGTTLLSYSPRHRLNDIQRVFRGDSQVVLVNDRLLIRIRSYREITNDSRMNPLEFTGLSTEFIRPHTRENYQYDQYMDYEMSEACSKLCRDDSTRHGFAQHVH
jgi:hypothetical protein